VKFLVTSDWHLDAVTAGVPRIDEFEGYLAAMCRTVVDEGVAAVLFAGDAFDPGRMLGPLYTRTLIEAAHRLTMAARRKISVWIAGNHDVIEDSRGVTTLSPLAAHSINGRGDLTICVTEKPAAFEVGPVTVLCLPYMARAADTDPEAWRRAFARAEDRTGPLVVLGHMTVPGALLGSESHEMARGRDLDLPVDALARLRPDVVINGHYHKAQVVRGRLDVLVPGSPHRFTFGERHDEAKGFAIVEVP